MLDFSTNSDTESSDFLDFLNICARLETDTVYSTDEGSVL